MTLYKNRAGREINLDQHSPDVIRRIAAGELTMVKGTAKVAAAPVVIAAPKVEECKKELTEKYKEVFGKRPFAGWDVDKLKEKLAEKL